ncbi:hypothetical protein BS17DRAFT_881546 [Gyrodon lividus]|nr:hypothetical protein BS17DRAFT_881546 [Gyrodon lividus]
MELTGHRDTPRLYQGHLVDKSRLPASCRPRLAQESKPSSKNVATSNKENAEAAKPEKFRMTDALFTLVEDSVTWKGALGLDIDPRRVPYG